VTEVVPNQKKHTLVPLLLAVDPTTIDPEPLKRVLIPGSRLRTRAFIKTQDGCQHHCAFCITTIARGESRSLPLERVVEEVRAAIRGGTREAVLTGVQLGSWGKDLNPSLTLPDLIEAILKETEISRLRMSSIEPWEVSPALIGLIQEERIARHLHLPLQSGSAAVLRRMGRAITPLQYEALITRIRESIPEIAITTDILTGFPAESEQEFEEGLEYIQRMKFADGHVFSFSARPGTPAADFPEQVKHPIRKRRAAVIRKLFMESAAVYREQFLGTQLTPLWEQVEHLGDGSWKAVGLTDNYLRVEATGSESLWNTFSTIRVTGITPKGISGKILDP
jgi:threonylcarbamoyladenosine tRNA methylthiotransferase MtaB